MPRKRRKVSAFLKILLALTLVCGALVGVGYYVITTVDPLDTARPVEPGCRLSTADDTYSLEPEQTANAATVGGVAFSRELPRPAVVVAYATVWQESTFYNIGFGDRDSLGLFQQRPSQEWGEPEQIMDPVYASQAFYDELRTVEAWEELPVFEAAQRVQRSADGYAYDQHESISETMASVFTGAEGAAATCWFDEETLERISEGEADVAAAESEMARVFGTDPAVLPLEEEPRTGDLGWAMALWAVAHADQYGLSSVTYDGLRWTASTGEGDAADWTVPAAPAPAGRVVLR